MAKFEIKHRYNGSVIFECEAVSLRVAVEMAVSKRVSLRYADLSSADLSSADLVDWMTAEVFALWPDGVPEDQL